MSGEEEEEENEGTDQPTSVTERATTKDRLNPSRDDIRAMQLKLRSEDSYSLYGEENRESGARDLWRSALFPQCGHDHWIREITAIKMMGKKL